MLRLCLFAIAAIAAFVSAAVGQLTFDNIDCRSPGYATAFLACCRSDRYGDYEHGGLYYGTEMRAIANMRAADVLILGSSLTQAGFSSDATHEYFKLRAVPYFLLGFGSGGASTFTR